MICFMDQVPHRVAIEILTESGSACAFAVRQNGKLQVYTLRKKVLQSTYFWCFSLSQIEDSIEYMEGPNGIWKHHNRQIGVPVDPNLPVMVLTDTIWSFHVLNRVLYL